ncbi:hypothetical protein A2803_01250 [Candidatus Woesebacteria bacterium RIFCSPHIGHO2_01_FULL_44_21]|uniref:Uncharacterized protein n=1 Tax=Candidatus Woesebacteria bacterium RIFCSPHIGHO2_01_FULL_44_21 TaxID=1802503 RepID=A0A1F7Z138_9BACT|nr:MAG: hypothetical protein A2803_01250 [Candidatus Woesebacteria bacterium RIFCSPHIGHO2_01_FULL_44_21]OGM70818.1 MAG: hypothetical protein A2897_05240 [Candidatus Woesebacteria bacterium RIFCSPLOWO2_01_FULL_44_24b]
MQQRGIIHLLPLVLVGVLVVVLLALAVLSGGLPKSVQQTLLRSTPESVSVSLSQEYNNPFDSNSQYVNPFSTYKNPFDLAK